MSKGPDVIERMVVEYWNKGVGGTSATEGMTAAAKVLLDEALEVVTTTEWPEYVEHMSIERVNDLLYDRRSRTLSRLEAIRDDLKRGMK